MSDSSTAKPEKRPKLGPGPAEWQQKWYDVIFEHDTAAGRWFDLGLLVVIVASIIAVMLESIHDSDKPPEFWYDDLRVAEWIITILFTVEFAARLACVNRPARYVFSFFGVVDLVSLLPTYLMLVIPSAGSLATIRTVRLLRVFRILKLAHHVREGQGWLMALKQTWPKITVFISVIVCTIIILGSVMYLVEGGADSGFDNIPVSVYWAIVTMTTVGYGDIAPVTPLGKTIAALVMLLGYAIIIVPTGLFSAEVLKQRTLYGATRSCTRCPHTTNDDGARYCSRCGEQLGNLPSTGETATT